MTFEQAEKEMNKKGFFFTGKPSRKVGNYASRPIVFKDAQGNTHNYLSREHCAEYVEYEIENGFGLWATTEKDDAEYRAEAGPAVSEFYGVTESPRRAKCAEAGRAVRALQWENAKREVHELRGALESLYRISLLPGGPADHGHAEYVPACPMCQARAALDNCKELI